MAERSCLRSFVQRFTSGHSGTRTAGPPFKSTRFDRVGIKCRNVEVGSFRSTLRRHFTAKLVHIFEGQYRDILRCICHLCLLIPVSDWTCTKLWKNYFGSKMISVRINLSFITILYAFLLFIIFIVIYLFFVTFIKYRIVFEEEISRVKWFIILIV